MLQAKSLNDKLTAEAAAQNEKGKVWILCNIIHSEMSLKNIYWALKCLKKLLKHRHSSYLWRVVMLGIITIMQKTNITKFDLQFLSFEVGYKS